MSFSNKTREQNIEEMKSQEFDLVIIGGGITGSGVARDATSRGLKVALVEARDFAIGTSSRSSKLIHGGVRYLENFEFSLVFEALAERALLFKMAPHLVHPLRFMIPIYKSSRVGYWKMLLGMWLYDLLALFETPQMHESLNPTEAIKRIPALNERELTGAMEYSDAYTDDDRLVIETLRDANRRGAVQGNYLNVEGAERSESGIVKALTIKDQISGKTFSLKGKQFVSGVGPWTDILGEQLNDQWIERLRPTKGVHLVFSRERVPVGRAVVMAVEKRIIFVIPRHEMVIVGTTDTDFSGDPKDVKTTSEDVKYLLGAINGYFPTLKVTESDILSSYSGVRPLVEDGSTTEGKTSREHSIFSHGENLTFVAGGKYTTYRKISEDVVDHVLSKMDFDDAMAFAPSQTKVALNPQISVSLYDRAIAQQKKWAKEYQFSESLVELLISRHGLEAEWILQKIKADYTVYSANEALWMGEAAFAIENTMCLNLVDFYWRRSPLFLSTKDHGVRFLKAISYVFAEAYDWTSEQTKSQQELLMAQMQYELAWQAHGESKN